MLHIVDLDAALMRPGRIDHIVHVDLPNKNDRKKILFLHLFKLVK